MTLKIVLNLYVIVERVLKQLISSFDTALALIFQERDLIRLDSMLGQKNA